MIQEMVTASSVTSDTIISFGGSMPKSAMRKKTLSCGSNGIKKKDEPQHIIGACYVMYKANSVIFMKIYKKDFP